MKPRLSIMLVSLLGLLGLLGMLAALAVSVPAFAETQGVAVRFEDAFFSVPSQASAAFDMGTPSDRAEVGGAPLTADAVSDAFLDESARDQSSSSNPIGTTPLPSGAVDSFSASISTNPDLSGALALPLVGEQSVGGRPDAVQMGNAHPDVMRAPEPTTMVLLAWGTLAFAIGSLVLKKVPSNS